MTAFADSPWSDIITLEDLDQVDGKILLRYRQTGSDPIVNDEDRYELYRNAGNRRYFFRRLMWASLLSGGHATYGGLKTYEAHDGGPTRGVQGYFDANRDGVVDVQEWEHARAVAEREAAREYAENLKRDQLHTLRRPTDGRYFLLSNLEEFGLLSRYRWRKRIGLGLFLLLGGVLAVMLSTRL